MTGFLQVSTATQSHAEAVRPAQSLVSARLAAGARIAGPVTSVFRHEGECGTGAEWQLLLATRADRYDEVEAHLLAHHPWWKPEVTAVPMVAGSKETSALGRDGHDAGVSAGRHPCLCGGRHPYLAGRAPSAGLSRPSFTLPTEQLSGVGAVEPPHPAPKEICHGECRHVVWERLGFLL